MKSGEFTGQYDCDGKPIHGDDIVTFGAGNMVVDWGFHPEKGFCWLVLSPNNIPVKHRAADGTMINTGEFIGGMGTLGNNPNGELPKVIGNWKQNPELVYGG